VKSFVELVRAADPKDYATNATGTIWLLKDNVARYTASSNPEPFAEGYAPVNLEKGPLEKQSNYVSFSQPSERLIESIATAMHWDIDSDLSRVAWGLLRNIACRLQQSVGIGNHHLTIRPLVDPERSKVLRRTNGRTAIPSGRVLQLVGVEFFGVNRFLTTCLPWGCIEWWGVIATDENRLWQLDRTNPHGESLKEGPEDLAAFLAVVDDRQLSPEETKLFYNQLRSQEVGWGWYRENNISWRELRDAVVSVSQRRPVEEAVVRTCVKAGLLSPSGVLSAAGISLISEWTSEGRRDMSCFPERGLSNG
jgi:hypothetical protein